MGVRKNMKKIILLTLLSFFSSICIFSQNEILATTLDGRSVILKENGKWEFAPVEKIDMQLMDFNIIPRSKDYENGRISDDLILSLKLKNVSGKSIQGYRITVDVRNGFGDLLKTLTITDGDENMENDTEEEAYFVFEYNKFIDNQVYDDVRSFSKANLILKLIKTQIIVKVD